MSCLQNGFQNILSLTLSQSSHLKQIVPRRALFLNFYTFYEMLEHLFHCTKFVKTFKPYKRPMKLFRYKNKVEGQIEESFQNVSKDLTFGTHGIFFCWVPLNIVY